MSYFYSLEWLPIAFMVLLGVAATAYAILDGYDLGLGMLASRAEEKDQDRMISSIGPFWDANETWLVLTIGLLLVAFPKAYGLILTSLYLPVAIMLIGLILRGVAFEFRIKSKSEYKKTWTNVFIAGSFITAFTQGFMLGSYILGFESSASALLFKLLTGVFLCFGYCLMGASWLVWKTDGELQKKAVNFGKKALFGGFIGLIITYILAPIASSRIADVWSSMPGTAFVVLIPILCLVMMFILNKVFASLPKANDKHSYLPFVLTMLLFVVAFLGIAGTFYPFVVPGKVLISEAAISLSSLLVMFIGAVATVPIILGYTFFTYWVFRGKTNDIQY